MLVESYNNVGLSLVYTGRPEESLQWFEQALKRDPKNPRIKDNYEWARGQIKK
jgi:Tfp pilus assembly protein PilF